MVEAELYTHAQPLTANLGVGRSASARAKFQRSTRRNDEGMVIANDVVRALLSVCSQIAIRQVVVAKTLVSHDAVAFENRQTRGTWESTHVDLVGRRTRCRAD